MLVPTRYLAWFTNVWTHTGYRSRSVTGWACNYCERQIKPNTAGAQSHVSKHLRNGITTMMSRAAAERRRKGV